MRTKNHRFMSATHRQDTESNTDSHGPFHKPGLILVENLGPGIQNSAAVVTAGPACGEPGTGAGPEPRPEPEGSPVSPSPFRTFAVGR